MDCLITFQLIAGEKQEKEVKKTVFPALARPAAIPAALVSATPASIKRLGKALANLFKNRADFKSASTIKQGYFLVSFSGFQSHCKQAQWSAPVS